MWTSVCALYTTDVDLGYFLYFPQIRLSFGPPQWTEPIKTAKKICNCILFFFIGRDARQGVCPRCHLKFGNLEGHLNTCTGEAGHRHRMCYFCCRIDDRPQKHSNILVHIQKVSNTNNIKMLTFKLDGRVPSFGQDRHLQRDQGVQGHWCQLQERLLQVLKRPRWGPPSMSKLTPSTHQ